MFPIFEPVATILCFSSRNQQCNSVNMNDLLDLVALDTVSRLWDSLRIYGVSYNLHLSCFQSDMVTFNSTVHIPNVYILCYIQFYEIYELIHIMTHMKHHSRVHNPRAPFIIC